MSVCLSTLRLSYLRNGSRHVDSVRHGHRHVDENVLGPELEELGDVERDGEGDDGEDVADDPDPALPAVDAVVVFHRSGNCQVSTNELKQRMLVRVFTEIIVFFNPNLRRN